jgi:hypothetical protein
MKLPKKKTPAKKPRLHKVAESQDDNNIVLDLGSGYGAGTGYISGGAGIDTITIDSSSWASGLSGSTLISNGGYSITGSTTVPYTWTTTGTSGYQNDNTVHINADGLTMKEGADIKIGGKSLTDAIEKIEERLGILHPNPALEERWDKLKDLRRQYMEMEKDILEKEKIMKILKES